MLGQCRERFGEVRADHRADLFGHWPAGFQAVEDARPVPVGEGVHSVRGPYDCAGDLRLVDELLALHHVGDAQLDRPLAALRFYLDKLGGVKRADFPYGKGRSLDRGGAARRGQRNRVGGAGLRA